MTSHHQEQNEAPANANWQANLRHLQEKNHLTEDQEGALARYFREHERRLALELEDVAEKYKVMLKEDGEQQAKTWLQETATQMGRRDRNELNQFLESIGVYQDDPQKQQTPLQPAEATTASQELTEDTQTNPDDMNQMNAMLISNMSVSSDASDEASASNEEKERQRRRPNLKSRLPFGR